MKEIRTEVVKRAVKYEKKARKSEKRIILECIKDLDKETVVKEENRWEAARNGVLRGLGIEKEEVRKEREEGTKELIETIAERSERKEKEERRKKIEETRYNGLYKQVITENLPEYLRGRRKRKDRCLIARYRCGNEWRGNQHWKKEEDKICRICEREIESLEHMICFCQATRNNIQIGELLNGDGRGFEEMRRMEGERLKREEKGKGE